MGYYAIFLGLRIQHNIAMTKTLDADQYDESNTISFEIPLSLPYMADQPDFERVDGLFEHKGEFFRMVKQRYAKDTLTIICIRDTHNQKIEQALSDYVKTFADNPVDQDAPSKLSVSFIKEYISGTFAIGNICTGWETDLLEASCNDTLIASFVASINHPPEHS